MADAISQEQANTNFQQAEDRALMAGASFEDINSIRTRAGEEAGEIIEPEMSPEEISPFNAFGGSGEIIDPISGLTASPLMQPEIFLESNHRKQSHLRALLDVRSMNSPDENIEDLYRRTKVDVDRGMSESLMQDELLTYAAQQEQEALEVVGMATSLDPESIERSVEILDGISSIEEHFSDMDGYYQAVADYNAPTSVASLRSQENAVKGRAYQLLEGLTEEEGMLDIAIDYASLLVPDFLKDISDVVGDGLTSVSGLDAAIKNFQTMIPAEQAILIEDIIPALWKHFDGNHVKVAGMVATLFNKSGSGTDLVLGVGFEVWMAGDVLMAAKAAKGVMAARSLASRAVDTDGIESAARKQTIAGIDNPSIEDAIGVKPIDAAHSANPMPTSLIDEGTSIDNLAGEIAKIKKQQNAILVEELFPIAANKMSRGVMKQVFREKNTLQKAIAQLHLEKKAGVSAKGGAKAGQARKAQMSEINTKLALHEAQLARVDANIKANLAPVQAEADLSRLRQGIVPPKYKDRFDAAVESVKQTARAAKAERKAKPSPKKDKPDTAPNERDDNAARIEAVQGLGGVQLIKQQVARLVDDIITPQAFTPEEQAFSISKAQERLQKEIGEVGTEINSMDVVARDSSGFSLRYTTTDGASDRVFKFTKDDVGSVISVNEGRTFKQAWHNLFGKVFSPDTLLDNVFPDLVKNVTFAGQQTARLRNGLGQLWKESEKGLSKQEKFEVDSLLMAGDEETKVYSIAELRDGLVETQNGVIKMTSRQIESYYEKRTFFDEMHRLRSLTTKRQLEIDGFENLKYTHPSLGTQNLLGKRSERFDVSDIGVNEPVFFPGEDTVFRKGSSVHFQKDKLKADGYEVVRLFQPLRTKEGKSVKTALVKRESKWSGIPDETLHYQAGYVPRIYNKGHHYVRNMASANNEVLYAFPTREQAEAWSRQKPDTAVFADREFNAVERLVEDSNAYGGLYTGARKTRPLMLLEDGKEIRPGRMSVGGATEKYVQNISSIMPLNEYRATTMQTWKNTVANLAEAQGRTGLGHTKGFDEALDLEQGSINVMEQSRQYIKDNMGMPSREERVTERLMLGAANMMYGKPYASKTRQWLLDHSQGSVSDWMKGVSFNLHMGAFNLRQLFIQSQNASLAISMNPTLAPQALADALRLRKMSGLSNDKAMKAGKHLKYDSDIMQSMNEYNRSGMRDSIVRQADFDVNSAGIAHGSLDVARQASKAGRVFFNEGENFSRLVSWSIARRKWKDNNKGKALDDNGIIEVSQDALRMQLNMQSENAAWWQKAPGLNIATQFLQVQAKFLESSLPVVLGGTTKWTAAEKSRALAGQLFLYGVVGVPIAEEAAIYAAELAGQEPAAFIADNPGFTDAINEGFIGMIGNMLGAEDISATQNFNLLAGLDDNVISALAEGAIDVFNGGYSEEGAIEMFTGPSANIIRRVGDVAGGLMLSLKTVYGTPSMEVAYASVVSNLDDIAAMTSTWTNARKLMTLHNTDRLMSSRGTLVATSEELGDLSWQSQLGIAMGFATDIEAQHYANKEALKGAKQYSKDTIKDLKASLIQLANTGNEALYEAKKAVLLQPFSPTERIKILNTVNQDALAPKSAVDRETKAALRFIIESDGRIKPNVAQEMLFQGGNK